MSLLGIRQLLLFGAALLATMFAAPAYSEKRVALVIGNNDSGPLVHYSQILSQRCAVREMRIGIDTTVPNQVVKIPPCNPKDPSAIPENAASYMKIPPSTRSVSVELTYQDGSLSEIKNFRR